MRKNYYLKNRRKKYLQDHRHVRHHQQNNLIKLIRIIFSQAQRRKRFTKIKIFLKNQSI